MAKSKKTGRSHYELLYIVANKFTEDELKPIMEKVEKFITDHEGEITYKEEWGNKKMAYAISDFSFGYYNLVEFDVETVNLYEIDRALRLSNDVLRHQIVVKRKRSEEEIQKQKEEEKERMKKEKEKIKEETKKESKPKEEKRKTSKAKVDLNDLDEKLDKILDTNDLL